MHALSLACCHRGQGGGGRLCPYRHPLDTLVSCCLPHRYRYLSPSPSLSCRHLPDLCHRGQGGGGRLCPHWHPTLSFLSLFPLPSHPCSPACGPRPPCSPILWYRTPTYAFWAPHPAWTPCLTCLTLPPPSSAMLALGGVGLRWV
jgi:hypothetical protein